MPDFDVRAVGKSHQLVHPKAADHKAKLPFQLGFTDLMEPLTPETLGGFKYVSKTSDEYTKWRTGSCVLRSKNDDISPFHVLVQRWGVSKRFLRRAFEG